MNTVMVRRIVWISGFIVGALLLLAMVVLTAARLTMPSRGEMELGPVAGTLRDCPDTPNCVSSADDRPESGVEPIPYGDGVERARERARDALASLEIAIVEERDDYIHAEARSAVFGYVDDVELYFVDEASIMHFRSASRAGRSDMGVNRERYEAFRRAFSAH